MIPDWKRPAVYKAGIRNIAFDGHYEELISKAEASKGPTIPSLSTRIAAPRENFRANKKQGTSVVLHWHHSVLYSVL